MTVLDRYYRDCYEWSLQTFGPGPRDEGVIDHIRKELVEIEEAPTDWEKLQEWTDVAILAFDAMHRHGLTTDEVFDMMFAKCIKNRFREWPNWQTAEPGKAIEHVRT